MLILLSADIGGTTTRLRLSQFDSDELLTLKQQYYKSAEWKNFDALLSHFLQNTAPCHSACFAVAGPIIPFSEEDEENNINESYVNVTNLPWELNTVSLKKKFHFPLLSLINDFQAIGYSIDLLSENDVFTLQQGEQDKQNQTRAVIGAGTGLGQAICVFNGTHYDVISTEGGHCDFAPNTDFEVALYQFLNQQFSHVSYERLLSGEGLFNIYQFFSRICQPDDVSLQEEEKILAHADKAQAISQMAILNPDGLASRTLDLFFRLYGSQCGNLALNCLPTSGIYVAGGIAKKNLTYMKASHFLERFNAKGRMQKLLEAIPVKIIITDDAGLLGASNVALTNAHQI